MTRANCWSDSLTALTREALESHGLDMPANPTGVFHFKNINGDYGVMSFSDLMAGRFILRSEGVVVGSFDTADALIEAGWVLD